MSDHPDSSETALAGLRIGCVAYLNARPLIVPYPGPVTFDHPSALADALVRGALDVALIPVFEALHHPDFPIADGVSIASFGPVLSVFLAYRDSLSDVRTVWLDPASRTSVNLCRTIFAEWGGSIPDYRPDNGADPDGPCARLLIGNQALAFRERHGAAFRYLDLGEEWTRRTDLPFVFAVWAMRPETPEPGRVAAAFRDLARRGRAAIPEIAAHCTEFSEAFANRYLSEFIRSGLGDAEKQGIARFRQLLQKHALLPESMQELRFV